MSKSYERRSALLAKATGVRSNYWFSVWAAPQSEVEISVIKFLKRRHPKTITLSMQSIVDEIRDFVAEREANQNETDN